MENKVTYEKEETPYMNEERANYKINLELIISLVIVMGTIIGTTVPLYIHGSNQIAAIQQEMRDFHGRLERQDAEFKAGYLLLEEKISKK